MTSTDQRAAVGTGPTSALDGVYAAWGAHDADAFAACFTADATSILPRGASMDRGQIRDGMAAAFAGPFRGSSVIDQVQGVRMLGADAAIVVSRSAVVFAGESEPPADRWVLATWTLQRQGDAWLVAGYHNCQETPAA